MILTFDNCHPFISYRHKQYGKLSLYGMLSSQKIVRSEFKIVSKTLDRDSIQKQVNYLRFLQ